MTEQKALDEAQLKEQNSDFMQLCHKVFEQNEDGKRLLSMLKSSLLEQSPVADPNKSEAHAYFREGQNHLVRSILANIEQVKAQK